MTLARCCCSLVVSCRRLWCRWDFRIPYISEFLIFQNSLHFRIPYISQFLIFYEQNGGFTFGKTGFPQQSKNHSPSVMYHRGNGVGGIGGADRLKTDTVSSHEQLATRPSSARLKSMPTTNSGCSSTIETLKRGRTDGGKPGAEIGDAEATPVSQTRTVMSYEQDMMILLWCGLQRTCRIL